MDENATFEARAVLAPRRRRQSRLALLVPLLALVAVTWAGIGGGGQTPGATGTPDLAAAAVGAPTIEPTATPAATRGPRTARPSTAIGLPVHTLDQVQPRSLGDEDVIAIVGWYVTTAITDCPALAAIYRDGALPYVRGDPDVLAFCERTGVLYAAPPGVPDGRSTSSGPSVVRASIVPGVIVPRELENIRVDPAEVVVIGRFVPTRGGCALGATCFPVLVIDHVAWTAAG